MELETPDGYVLISKQEYKDIIRFVEGFMKFFDPTYIIFNRQLNTLKKLGERITKPKIKD